MKNRIFINMTKITNSALDFSFRGVSLFEGLKKYCNKLEGDSTIIGVVPFKSQIKKRLNGELLAFCDQIIDLSEDYRVEDFFIQVKLLSKDDERLIFIWGDYPLLDFSLSNQMIDQHDKYFADYTFADGYPLGLSPEILSPRVLDKLIGLASKVDFNLCERDFLFKTIQKDINSFDIETKISSKDLRLLRLTFSLEDRGNETLLERLSQWPQVDYQTILDRSKDLLALSRTLPYYFNIQIVEQCLQSCTYCPYPKMNKHHRDAKGCMDSKTLFTLLQDIEDFAPEARVCLSLWGEVSTHKEIYEILDYCINKSHLNYIIETSGLGWGNICETHPQLVSSSKIDWIFSLDTNDPQLYKNIRGEGFDEGRKQALAFLALNPEHTWIQGVRLLESEESLEEFYKFWKEKTPNLIIQKYDHFSKKLESKKVTDLSPVRRQPCWHLKRDMSILFDGKVTLCREDIDNKYILGSLSKDSLKTLWERGELFFKEQQKEEFREICQNCDEYYTYNF